jgi:hypothetical protein
MLGMWVVLILLLTGFVVSFSYFSQDDSKVAEQMDLPGARAQLDSGGNALSVTFPDSAGHAPTQSEISPALMRIHMFALGALTGIGSCLLGAKLLLGSQERAGCAIWLFAWLCVALVISVAVYAAERIHLARLRRHGVFEQQISAGVDPLLLAGSIYLSLQKQRLWSAAVTFLGIALLAVTDRYGWPIAIPMTLIPVWLVVRLRRTGDCHVKLRNIETELMRAREFMLDGGWVFPLGTSLATASLGLMYFSRAETWLLMFVLVAGCLLVVWSEQASRGKARRHTLDQWREIYRKHLIAPQIQQASIETIS